ncbi:uncharacterized protein LOC115307359 isoform X8 [Manacus vitellinus]|uniref:uncharacterized protein LOC115307359 isoform X8 n=1 Tax=Manacus vitellinus TaxID=328815 RepID=UPI00115C576F|nr:uncharacterized protein LOC115307359 isoform X8 [Manacus vitellinus]
MNCLAGNGGTGWTLHCSLGMCGSPLRNCRNSWCRLGRWIGRPSPSVPARPLGPCPVVALPALQVKWEGPLQVWWVTFIAGENGASGQEEEKPRDSSLSPRQPMNCLAGNGGTGWTLHCSLGMCGTAGTPGAAWADGLDAPAPPFLPGHWGRVQWWHCQPCSGMEPGKCTELSPGIERDQAREVKKEGRREVRQQASSTKLLCKQVSCVEVPQAGTEDLEGSRQSRPGKALGEAPWKPSKGSCVW